MLCILYLLFIYYRMRESIKHTKNILDVFQRWFQAHYEFGLSQKTETAAVYCKKRNPSDFSVKMVKIIQNIFWGMCGTHDSDMLYIHNMYEDDNGLVFGLKKE